MDFSDPQGGKGPCDRKAATVKNHLRSYLNSGNDISNAAQMKTAIESVGGVRSVRAVLCGPLTIPDAGPFGRWEGVSFINDIEFKDEHMKVWRAYGVGVGKEITYSNFQSKTSPAAELMPSFSKLEDASDPNLTFCDVTPRHNVKKRTTEATAKSPDESSDTDDNLFTCSEVGCVKTFQRFSSLQSHLDIGKHKYALERETLLDKAMLRYAENLESGESAFDQIIESASGSSESLDVQPSPIGWALKSSASRCRLTKNQKKLARKQTLTISRDIDGSSLFKSDEYLTSKQIASFFSRLSSKKSAPEANSTSDNDDDDDEDDNDKDDDLSSVKEYHRIRDEILNEISLNHPIIYDSYNICGMAATSKLPKFSIAMLQVICRYFELDISSVKQKRKKPYVDMLVNLVQS
ncbi:SURP and G-patch domain-containing 1, partial [Paramuricea clavata]